MKLSTKGRYGARAALELATKYGAGLVMVREIAASQDISMRYLEHILNALRAAGIVKSTRGAKGGYELARSPSEITLGEIIQVLEGPMDIVPCVGDNNCGRMSKCVMCSIWNDVKIAIDGVLGSITLEDMMEKHDELNKKHAYEYII